MISNPTADHLLRVARMARDRIDYRIKSGFDTSPASATELADLETLIAAVHLEMKEGPDPEFAARQHLQTVKAQETLLTAGYDKLELAARVVCRVAKTDDAVELRDVIANLGRVVDELTPLRGRSAGPSSARMASGVPCGQAGCVSCHGTGRVVVDTRDIRTTQRCACTLVK